MFELNEKIKNLTPYDPITGSFAIRLDANESFVLPNEEIRREIISEVEKIKFNRYPDPYATELCKDFSTYYGVPKDNVVAGDGSDELISIIMNAFLEKGDTVLTLSNDFSMYSFYSSIVECKNITVKKNDDYSVDIDKVIDTANKEKSRIIIFSNPCNPTGLVVNSEDVRRLIKSVNSLVVLDEAYMDFSSESLVSEFSEYDNLIILKTCSKAIGMAGIRLGFAIANDTLTSVLKAVKSPYNVNTITQKIGSVIFSHPDYIDGCVKRVLESRDQLYKLLKALEGEFEDILMVIKPQTNFIYMKCKNSKEIYEHLLSKSIVVRLMGDCLRITAGRNYENSEVTDEIRLFLTGGNEANEEV